MGSSSGNHGARASIARHLKVLLPSSTSRKLRISDELAQHWDDGGVGAGGTALVVSPFGKIWRVEVGRDAGGAFLGRGWQEFVDAHGFGVGWFLVFRHEPCGVLTIKAFDTTCCLREFGRPLSSVAANYSSGGSRRPQFINVLLPSFTKKMGIPPKFVQKYIAESEMKSPVAVLLSPLCKFCRIVVEKDESGNMFFSGGWSQFLVSHGITEFDVLLLRYEGNMVFTMKVFGPDGCQKGCKDQDTSSKELDRSNKTAFGDIKTLEDEEDPASSSSKRKSMAKKPDGEKNSKRQRKCTTSLNKALSSPISVYEIGPPSWKKREINAYTPSNHLTVAGTFCKAIGLQKRASEITLRTTSSAHSTRTWQVRFLVYKYRSCTGQLTRGWRGFCVDNAIKEGDICTFNVVETTLWHVEIMRRS